MRSHAYDDMPDEELFALSQSTLSAATDAPLKSIKRAGLFAAYDEIVRELSRRLGNHAARELGLPEEP